MERTQGALTFTGVAPVETEEGAVSSVSLDPIRWLEPDDYSDLDICPERTFLLLTRAEEEQLAPWLAMTGAPKIHENDTYAIYGFGSSMEICSDMLLGKDEAGKRGFCGRHIHDFAGRAHARADFVAGEGHVYAAGELRGRRQHGADVCDARFEMIGEAELAPGENSVRFTLEDDDKYFMLLIRSGENEIRLTNLELLKE